MELTSGTSESVKWLIDVGQQNLAFSVVAAAIIWVGLKVAEAAIKEGIKLFFARLLRSRKRDATHASNGDLNAR